MAALLIPPSATGPAGGGLCNPLLDTANTNARGATTTSSGDTLWVIDSSKTIYVYNNDTGNLLGSG